MFLGQEGTLGDEILVGGSYTKVEQVAKSSQHVGVMETDTFLPESRSVSNDVTLNFEEKGAALANSVTETKLVLWDGESQMTQSPWIDTVL